MTDKDIFKGTTYGSLNEQVDGNHYKGMKIQPAEFINENHLEFFRQKLLIWKKELLNEASDTKDDLSEDGLQRPDIADRAQVESNATIQLRTRDRERKLISKIDSALRRIDLGTYGYCEETDEPIGIKRLIARPIASLCLDAQERHEKMERIHKDD